MFVPRYSIRAILLITAGFAVFFLLIGLGIRGHTWAGAVAVGIGSLAFVAIVHAAFFSLCWALANRPPQRGLTTSTEHKLPPPEPFGEVVPVSDDTTTKPMERGTL